MSTIKEKYLNDLLKNNEGIKIWTFNTNNSDINKKWIYSNNI